MQIEPCPFCGGEASVVQFVGDLYVVKCDYCFVRTSKYSEKEKAISAWNRRKAPEIVYCKDCRKHNVKVGFDENFHTVWKEDACPLVDWRGKAKEHEFDYQYCAFAERRTK